MNRLEKTLSISVLLISALAAETILCTPLFAQSDEAREFNRKGVVALESGRHSEAVQLLKQAMALAPKWGEPCYNAARLLRITGKREQYIKMLAKANGVEPDNPTYADEYLKVIREELEKAEKTNDTSEIKRLQKEILRVTPGDVHVGYIEVKEHLTLGEKAQAVEKAQKLIDLNSRLRTSYDTYEMGELFYIIAQDAFDKGNFGQAKINADNASKFKCDHKDDAEALAKKAKSAMDEKVASLIANARSSQESGDHEGAMSLLSQAQDIQPENETVKNLLVQFANDEDIAKEITKAQRFIANDRWLEGREILLKIQQVYPDDGKIKKTLASLADKEKALLKAIEKTEIPVGSETRRGIMLGFKSRAVEFYDGGNFNKAVSPFKKALAMVDADKELESYRGEIEDYLAKINELDERKQNWTKAREARENGEYEDVIKYLSKVPGDYDEQYDSFLGEAYYKTGDLEKAEELCHLQLSKQKGNNRAKFVLGSINLDNEKYDEAYKYFKEIFDDDPEYPEINDKLALASGSKFGWNIVYIAIIVLLLWIAITMKKKLPVYAKNGMVSKAKRLFKGEFYDECINTVTQIRHSPYLTPADKFDITKLMAQSYLKKGIYDRAIGECKQLISLSPKNEEAHTWLGYAYLGRRMLAPEALPELLNLYKKDSKNIALVSLLGSYYAQQKSLSDEGVEILEQWLNLDHDNVEVLKPLGRYYLKKNISNEKAMKVYQKMMEIGSPESEFMLGVANVYLRSRQFDNCLQLCEQVINNDINNEYVHAIMLDAYKKQNRLSELLVIYKNFLQNNPYNVAFQNGLKAAQEAYEKSQARNAAQAAAQAAAVMQKMQDLTLDDADDNSGEMGFAEGEAANVLLPGQIACPSCGKGNPEGAYCCQHCGASMFQ